MQEKRRIGFSNPTSRAFGRMTTFLFRPFDAGKWFTVGFSAWLAMLGQNNGGGANINIGDPTGGMGGSTGDPEEQFQEMWDQAVAYFEQYKDVIIGVGIGLIVLFLVLGVVFLWLSSRGKFMLLDNLVHNRALVKAPWAEFKKQGNSLFVWRLVFTILSYTLILGTLAGIGFWLYANVDLSLDEYFENGPIEFNPAWVWGIVGVVLFFILVAIIFAYIMMLLEDFVVPLMYKHSLSVTDSWRRVLALHNRNFGKFFLFFLWKALLLIGAGIAVTTIGFLTCCIGFLVLAIPYIGAVLMLPITLAFRGLGPEFIRQFGDEFDLWEGSPDNFGFAPATPGLPPHLPNR